MYEKVIGMYTLVANKVVSFLLAQKTMQGRPAEYSDTSPDIYIHHSNVVCIFEVRCVNVRQAERFKKRTNMISTETS